MCFLYRQSISIVYESKFKYIYRYFIKIDRCFCGILQSLPLRKCGLKFTNQQMEEDLMPVTSLAEVWIEIVVMEKNTAQSRKSLPLRKCGLKSELKVNYIVTTSSLPLRKCGLKYPYFCTLHRASPVTSLAEVWIEIKFEKEKIQNGRTVTSLAEVWIEMHGRCAIISCHQVTSLAEVWIEMIYMALCRMRIRSLPLRKCGLKYLGMQSLHPGFRHFPCGSVD